MRDPTRIPVMLEALKAAWEKNPDLRLTQLLVNTLDARPNPIFYVEDDITLARLKGEDVPVPAVKAGQEHEKRQEIGKVIDTISKWWAFRESDKAGTGENAYAPKIKDPRTFYIEAEHALRGGLLGRMLLEDKEPLPLPPPRNMSRPWYALIDNGEANTFDVFALESFNTAFADETKRGAAHKETYVPKPGENIVVGQEPYGWTFVEALGPHDWSIRHPGVGVCRATRLVATNPIGSPGHETYTYWKLKVTEPVVAPAPEKK